MPAPAPTDFELEKARIIAMPDKMLWEVVRGENCMTERSCYRISQAKFELKRRGFSPVGL